MAPRIRATVLLCDAAQAVGGKLYVLGGGWSQMFVGSEATNTANMGLAVRLDMPRSLANQMLALAARLLDADGQPVEAEGNPVAAQGEIPVGDVVTFGAAVPRRRLDTVVALQFNGVPLKAGRYTWELAVNDAVVAQTEFQVTVLNVGGRQT